MTRPISLAGEWGKGVALGFHNLDPAPALRTTSINNLSIRLSGLGKLVLAAKYGTNEKALKKLERLIVNAAEFFRPFSRIYYVPPRDSKTRLNENLALELARAYRLELPRPAFDWTLFSSFRKGMERAEIDKLLRNIPNGVRESLFESDGKCLLIDDTVWSGSTLYLTCSYLRQFSNHRQIDVLCLTKVYEAG